MNVKNSVLALALGLALSGAASADSMSSSDAEELMMNAGLSEISALRFHDDLWFATARNRDGKLVDVRVDPDTREVTWTGRGNRSVTTTTTTTTTTRRPVVVARAATPVVVEEVVEAPVVRTPVVVEDRVLVPVGGRLNKSDVRRVLAANGYHDIHDIDYKRHLGIWKAEARDASGDKLEIRVDPIDGRILHVEDD